MNRLTEPTKASKAWERENAKLLATLKRTVPRGRRARAKLIEIAATVQLIDKAAIAAERQGRGQ
jgi:hypothetical protein